MSQLRTFCGSNHEIRPMNHIRIWLKWAPFKQKSWLKCAHSNSWDLNQINLIYAFLSRIQLQWLIKKFLMCVFCCWKICTEGNSDTLIVLKRRPSISVLSTCDNASKSWEFFIWLRSISRAASLLETGCAIRRLFCWRTRASTNTLCQGCLLQKKKSNSSTFWTSPHHFAFDETHCIILAESMTRNL